MGGTREPRLPRLVKEAGAPPPPVDTRLRRGVTGVAGGSHDTGARLRNLWAARPCGSETSTGGGGCVRHAPPPRSAAAAVSEVAAGWKGGLMVVVGGRRRWWEPTRCWNTRLTMTSSRLKESRLSNSAKVTTLTLEDTNNR